jgi:hypothetical protein
VRRLNLYAFLPLICFVAFPVCGHVTEPLEETAVSIDDSGAEILSRQTSAPIFSIPEHETDFHWKAATKDSFKFLLVQTGARLAFQAKRDTLLTGHFGVTT